MTLTAENTSPPSMPPECPFCHEPMAMWQQGLCEECRGLIEDESEE